MDGRQFIIELTMGAMAAYLPTESRWEAAAPDWAKGQWDRVKGDLSAWCDQQRWPLHVEESAWVQFQ